MPGSDSCCGRAGWGYILRWIVAEGERFTFGVCRLLAGTRERVAGPLGFPRRGFLN